MDQPHHDRKVSAIVAAYNEEARIGAVLDLLTTCSHLDEVIVVNDGSTDKTEAVVKRYPTVRYTKHATNRGKGAAIDTGVQLAGHDVLFFCDADISGLTHNMIQQMTEPVTSGRVEMFIGMRNRKIYLVRYFLSFVPLVGGERALTKNLWQSLPAKYKERFKIEAALNFYAAYEGKGFDYCFFSGVTQTIKEKKYGLGHGFTQRMQMYAEITVLVFQLQLQEPPHVLRTRRLLWLGLLRNIVGIAIGSIIMRLWPLLIPVGLFLIIVNMLFFALSARNLVRTFHLFSHIQGAPPKY
ncbi:MAG: glycosyltransferase family 2 protein [Candidatus Kerfeldbacteria bacterium]|nr:glycosyltransferase family 2 protein [Candidatus Kerfeldbacteria bacterium]